jgi:hypothetical protein
LESERGGAPKVYFLWEADPSIPHHDGYLLAVRRLQFDMDLAWLSRGEAMLERVGDQLGENQPARNGGIRGEEDLVGLDVDANEA